MLCLIHDKCHVMQQFALFCLKEALIEIVKREEIPEADILEVRSHGAVNADT